MTPARHHGGAGIQPLCNGVRRGYWCADTAPRWRTPLEYDRPATPARTLAPPSYALGPVPDPCRRRGLSRRCVTRDSQCDRYLTLVLCERYYWRASQGPNRFLSGPGSSRGGAMATNERSLAAGYVGADVVNECGITPPVCEFLGPLALTFVGAGRSSRDPGRGSGGDRAGVWSGDRSFRGRGRPHLRRCVQPGDHHWAAD